jgi:CRISPR-associated endonuclease Cas2
MRPAPRRGAVLSERRTYLVAYDIRAPRRLARVHRALSEAGYWLQYSVFAVDLTDRERVQLMARLRRLINEADDDVRFYLVPGESRGAWQGPRGEAVAVSAAPAATLAERLAKQADEV